VLALTVSSVACHCMKCGQDIWRQELSSGKKTDFATNSS
jgi:hypothetical protein